MTSPLRISFVIYAASLGATAAWAQQDGGFAPVTASRYEGMERKSPFALATATAPPPGPPAASFASNWYVVGVGRLGETDFATIKSRDAGTVFSLYGSETHPSTGATLVSVSWSETVGKSTVVLRKGTEMAKLEFNEEEIRSGAAAAAAPRTNPGNPINPANPNAMMAPNPAAMSGGMNPPPMSGGSLPPPTMMPRNTGNNPVYVTPPQQGVAPMNNLPPGAVPGAGGEIRRRVRPIPMPNPPPAGVPGN